MLSCGSVTEHLLSMSLQCGQFLQRNWAGLGGSQVFRGSPGVTRQIYSVENVCVDVLHWARSCTRCSIRSLPTLGFQDTAFPTQKHRQRYSSESLQDASHTIYMFPMDKQLFKNRFVWIWIIAAHCSVICNCALYFRHSKAPASTDMNHSFVSYAQWP